jgi:hypothetical protein
MGHFINQKEAMQCINLAHKRHPKTNQWFAYPCGQCTPCRINKKSMWTFRNILESRSALTSSFWTLTLDDAGLDNFGELTNGSQKLLRTFINSLRKSEVRHGNFTPIRYFGCFEYGETLGRPHWHVLIYNLIHNYREPPPYQKGLPRPRQHSAQWPHGHVDIGEFNPATINYTISYLMKGSCHPEMKPRRFGSVRPGIGFYGLQSLAVNAARQHLQLEDKAKFFKIGNRTYPIDAWTQATFDKLYKQAGGVYTNRPTPFEKRAIQISDELDRNAQPLYIEKRLHQRIRHIETQAEWKKQKQAFREKHVSAIYAQRTEEDGKASRNSSSSTTHTTQTAPVTD